MKYKETLLVPLILAAGTLTAPIQRLSRSRSPQRCPRLCRRSKPAKFLVFLFKDKGAPILVPEN